MNPLGTLRAGRPLGSWITLWPGLSATCCKYKRGSQYGRRNRFLHRNPPSDREHETGRPRGPQERSPPSWIPAGPWPLSLQPWPVRHEAGHASSGFGGGPSCAIHPYAPDLRVTIACYPIVNWACFATIVAVLGSAACRPRRSSTFLEIHGTASEHPVEADAVTLASSRSAPPMLSGQLRGRV